MPTIDPAIQLAINAAVRASEKEAELAREKLATSIAAEVAKAIAPVSQILAEQTKTIGALRDESLRTKVEVEVANSQLERLIERRKTSPPKSDAEPAASQEVQAITLRSMDNRTRITLAIIALVPAAVAASASALAAYLATK